MLRTTGIHHITAIASDPQRNLDFYTGVLGLRLVKQTVNFDDPGTYHFYFGDEGGSPGTILTFFPWPHINRGVHGAGAVATTTYAVPSGSLGAWADRLASHDVTATTVDRFGQTALAFEDPDGLKLELIEDQAVDAVPAWTGGGVGSDLAIRGFHSATLLVRDLSRMEKLLAGAFGMEKVATEGNRTRFRAIGEGASPNGRFVDVIADPTAPMHKLGGGIVHHIAMRAASDAQQAEWAKTMIQTGLRPTPVADRFYFRSIYFREPQGVLFEIATDGPGFATDEPLGRLGETLKLPAQEHLRDRIESVLPKVVVRT